MYLKLIELKLNSMEGVENDSGEVETYNSREGEMREMVEVETCRTMKKGEISLEVEVKSSGTEVVVKEMVKVEWRLIYICRRRRFLLLCLHGNHGC